MSFDFSTLSYRGQCWPTARVVRRTRALLADPAGGPSVPILAAELEVTGKGREISETGPQAWWRTFTELDLDDDKQVEAWLQRRGDPFGHLTPRAGGDTAGWGMLKSVLQPAAALWRESGDPVRRRGAGQQEDWRISRPRDDIAADEFGRVQARLVAHPLFAGLDIRVQETVVSDGHLWLSVSARTLASHMVASAAFQIHARSMMKRCRHCDWWFSPVRFDARYDSAACRQAAHLETGD